MNEVVIERIEAYFKSTENADEYVCPCNEKNSVRLTLSWNHCQATRIKNDLIEIFRRK